MGQKTVKAATKTNKMLKKAKDFASGMSPAGVANALGDYLLSGKPKKKAGGAKTVKARK